MSPQFIGKTAMDLASQLFLKLLRKDFKDGSYYRTIISHVSAAQSTRAIQHSAANAVNRGAKGSRKPGKSPDACVCMARVRGLQVEISCLTAPTPAEEFELGLISQYMAYRVTETSIRLACVNLEHIMRRVAQASGENESGRPTDETRGQAAPAPTKLEIGSSVEVTGLVAAAQHNGRRGIVGKYDAEKQRYAVSLQAEGGSSEGESLKETKIAVKAANLLLLATAAATPDAAKGSISAMLWGIESKGTLSAFSPCSDGGAPVPRSWVPVGPLPACLTCPTGELVAQMASVEHCPRPRTLVAEATDGTRVQMQVAVQQDADERLAVEATRGKLCGRVSTGQPHKRMGVDELNESRLRLQLTAVIPKLELELTAAEKARPSLAPTSEVGGQGIGTGTEPAAAAGSSQLLRLWHSKHFIWYRLPPLQRLRSATLDDGVFGPSLDQTQAPSGIGEDTLLIEAFHDSGSGRLFLEATPASVNSSAEPCMMQHEVLGYVNVHPQSTNQCTCHAMLTS